MRSWRNARPTARESIGAVRNAVLRSDAGSKNPPNSGSDKTNPIRRTGFGNGVDISTAACSGDNGAGFSSLTFRSSSCNAAWSTCASASGPARYARMPRIMYSALE